MAAATPAIHLHPLLPKTPAALSARGGQGAVAARRPRRGEVVFAISENGSPLEALAPPAVTAEGANSRALHAALHLPLRVPLANPPSDIAADSTGDARRRIVTVSDETAAAEVAAAEGAEAVVSAIEAMEVSRQAVQARRAPLVYAYASHLCSRSPCLLASTALNTPHTHTAYSLQQHLARLKAAALAAVSSEGSAQAQRGGAHGASIVRRPSVAAAPTSTRAPAPSRSAAPPVVSSTGLGAASMRGSAPPVPVEGPEPASIDTAAPAAARRAGKQ